MSRIDGIRHRLYVLLRGERYADEVRRELRFHRDLDALADGGSSLGNETYYREEVRAMTLQVWVDRVLQDLSYAVRGLRRAPGFTIAVALILALGIGVNATMFSIIDHVFLRRPSGVVEPAALRRLYPDFKNGSGNVERVTTASTPYPWFRAADRVVDPQDQLFAFTSPDSVVVRDGTRRISAGQSVVTARYFSALGVRAQRGRLFTGAENDIETPTPVAIISDAFWKRAFSRNASVLGRHVRIGSTDYTIVGIAQPSFNGLDVDAVDVWTPANTYDGSGIGGKDPWYETFASSFNMVARPRDAGALSALENAAAGAIHGTHLRYYIDDPTLRVRSGSVVRALGPDDREKSTAVAIRVAGVSVVLLLIVVANVINMFLLRGMHRQREIAVRRALGVSRARLFQQLCVESLILAAFSALCAAAFAAWSQAGIRRLFFPSGHWDVSALEPATLAVIFAVALSVGLLAALAPMLGAFGHDPADTLRAGTKGATPKASAFRNVLLASQAALCVVLVIGAGLFVRSLDVVKSIDPGFGGRDQFFVWPEFDEPQRHRAEVRTAIPRIVQELRSVPGVEAAGSAMFAPMNGMAWNTLFIETPAGTIKSEGPDTPSQLPISPGFLHASGMSIVAGRDFAESDGGGTGLVAIVSAEMARHYWPNQSAIGHCLFIGNADAPCSQIVGVAANAHRMRVIEGAVMQYYVASAQLTSPPAGVIAVKAKPGQLGSVQQAAARSFSAAFPELVGVRVRTVDQITEPELRPWRLGATLFSGLGLLAMLVAAIGVYSVIAFGVSQRTHEMGIRLALGARGRDIVDLVLAEGLRVVGTGVAIGIVVALLLGRTVASLLFGVVPTDPSVIIGATTILAVVGAIATLVPGVRAARIDPVTALRAE